MTPLHQSLIGWTTDVIEEERRHSASLSGPELDSRYLLISEAELASRLRQRFMDLQTYLHAQGRTSERDIQSSSRNCEVEVKFWCGVKAQGGTTQDSPVYGDWNWLTASYPDRLERFWVCFFPKASSECKKTPLQVAGTRRFQQGISITPTQSNRDLWKPYWPVAEAVRPLQKRGSAFGPGNCTNYVLRFRTPIPSKQWLTHGNKTVLIDVCGSPYVDPIWATVYAISTDDVPTEYASEATGSYSDQQMAGAAPA